MTAPGLLTVDEAIAFLNVGRSTFYRHCLQLPAVRIGTRRLYVRADLEAWIEAQKQRKASRAPREAQTRPVRAGRREQFTVDPSGRIRFRG